MVMAMAEDSQQDFFFFERNANVLGLRHISSRSCLENWVSFRLTPSSFLLQTDCHCGSEQHLSRTKINIQVNKFSSVHVYSLVVLSGECLRRHTVVIRSSCLHTGRWSEELHTCICVTAGRVCPQPTCINGRELTSHSAWVTSTIHVIVAVMLYVKKSKVQLKTPAKYVNSSEKVGKNVCDYDNYLYLVC